MNNNNDKNNHNKKTGTLSSLVRYGSRPGYIFSAVSFVLIVVLSCAVFFMKAGPAPLFTEDLREPAGLDVLRIDGNRDGRFVVFTHKKHMQRNGNQKEGCVRCHHLSLPDDGPVSCVRCHRRMNGVTSIFNHDYHIARFNNDFHISRNVKSPACAKCHTHDKSPENRVSCNSCHGEYTRDAAYYTQVRGYKDALHGNCFQCHEKNSAKTEGGDKCSFCHSQGSFIAE